MPRFAANLTMLFNEVAFPDRFERAAACGFKGVEYLFPYDYPASELAEKLRANGLQQVLHNLPAGDWDAGERGIACLPDRVGEFQDGVGKAIEYARALDCPQLNCLAGIAPADADFDVLAETLVNNLKFAAEELAAAGIGLLIEPINIRDIPDFILCFTRQALDIIELAGTDNLRLQYDIYHMQVMEGGITTTLRDHLDVIGHIQIADNPGRNEPGTGELNYPFLFAELDRLGYDGWVGCEYKPLADTESGLGWAANYLK
jgi:hydroxypyruvate isomerase